MEILLFILEIVLDIGFEFLVSFFLGGVAEVGGHKVKKIRKKRFAAKVARARAAGEPEPEEPEPFGWFSAVLFYAVLGFLFGAASLLMFPESYIKTANGRLVYLFLAPLTVGMAMSLIGRVRNKNGEEPIRLDNFFYGFLFAFVMTLLRHYVAA